MIIINPGTEGRSDDTEANAIIVADRICEDLEIDRATVLRQPAGDDTADGFYTFSFPKPDAPNAAAIVRWENHFDDLVRALEFYADPRRYRGPNQNPITDDPYAKPDQVYIQDVSRDDGSIARAILAKVKP